MPPRVKEQHPQFRRHFVEDHNHNSGVCDLDEYMNRTDWVRTNCSLIYRGGRNIYCGCWMCVGQISRKQARSSERVQWRAIRQRLLAGEEIDVGPIRGRAW